MWRRKQQRRPSTYQDVFSVAEVLSRVNAGLIEWQFGVSTDTARQYMERLVECGLFGDLQPDGWHYPLTRRERLRRSRATQKATKKPKVLGIVTDQPVSVDDLSKRIGELERDSRALRARVKRLQNAGKTVIGQRDDWMARALEAEERLETEQRRRPTNGDDRFNALRRMIARELHPDHCAGDDFEKLARAEFFKRLWPEIERLAGQEK